MIFILNIYSLIKRSIIEILCFKYSVSHNIISMSILFVKYTIFLSIIPKVKLQNMRLINGNDFVYFLRTLGKIFVYFFIISIR